MGDTRNYAALEWVVGEIGDTLKEARQALEAYVEDPKDSTRIRFCLTHIHQVHGTLQMVEFHGASLLAEEMEQLTQALMNNSVSSTAEAHEVLMRSLLQLPIYLDHVKSQRDDHPGVILPLLNDLRAVRKQSYLSETNLFAPDLAPAHKATGARHPVAGDPKKLKEVLQKLREMYQFAAASVLRGVKLDENLRYLDKVCTRLETLTTGTHSHAVWYVAAAMVEALERDDLELSVAVRGLLRHLARELRILTERSPESLDYAPRESLLKNLLYYVARAGEGGERVANIKRTYQLDTALLYGASSARASDDDFISAPEPEAIRSVVLALQDEINSIKHILDISLTGQGGLDDLQEVLPVVKRVADTLAVLGIGDLRKQILEQYDEIGDLCETGQLDEDRLMRVAGRIIETEHRLQAVAKGAGKNRDLSSVDERGVEIDHAKGAVLNECQRGLEQAKDAIVEYIASKWDVTHLANVFNLMSDIRGGLEMIPLPRPAAIMGSCGRYIQEQLLDAQVKPDWETLDNLADTIASIDYYIERLREDREEDLEHLLDIAEQSINALGYQPSTKGDATDGAAPSTETEFAQDEVLEVDGTAEAAQPEAPVHDQELEEAAEADEAQAEMTADTDSSAPEPVEPVSAETDTVEAPVHTDEADDEPAAAPVEYEAIEYSLPVDETAQDDATPATEPSFAADADEEVIEEYPDWTSEEPVDMAQPEEPASITAEEKVEVELQLVDEPEQAAEQAPEVEETAAEPEASEPESDIDEEIIEIFVEEAGEVQETLAEFFPQWRQDQNDQDALTTVRRSFHTLKGSGRMVEAFEVGELAWSIENMLNRVLDNTISVEDEHFALIEMVLSILPEMVSAFETRTPNPQKAAAEKYMAWAFAAADGEMPNDLRREASRWQAGDAVEAPGAEAPGAEAPVAETQAVETKTTEDVADDDDADDLVLWEIFASEAQSHLATVDDFIREMEEVAPLYTPPSDDMQRALHTLKGSAHMAHVTPIAELATPFEGFVKELRAYQVNLTDDILQLVKDGVAYAREGLQAIEHNEPVELPKLPQFLARTAELRELSVGPLVRQKEMEKDGQKQVDPRLLSIFMAEEMKLLLDADQILADWQREPDNHNDIRPLVTELATLQHGAEQANLPEMAELSALLQQVYQRCLGGKVQPDAEMYELLGQGHDALLDMVDAVAAGQNLQPLNQALMANLRRFVETNAAEDLDALSDQPEEAAEVETSLESDPAVESESEAEFDFSLATETESETETEAETLPGIEATELSEGLPVESPEESVAADLAGDLSASEGDAPTDEMSFASANESGDAPALVEEEIERGSLPELEVTDSDLETPELETSELESSDIEGLAIKDPETESVEVEGLEVEGLEGEGSAVEGLDAEGLEDSESSGATSVEALDQPTAEVAEPTTTPADAIDPESPDAGLSETDEQDAVDTEVFDELSDTELPGSDSTGKQGSEPTSEASAETDDTEDAPAENAGDDAQPAEAPASLNTVIPVDLDDFDEEIIEIFLEEADELMEELDEAIHAWESDWSDTESPDTMARALHTLKGGARLASLNEIGELTHDYETFLLDPNNQPDEYFFKSIQAYQDKLLRKVKAVSAALAGEAPPAEPAEPVHTSEAPTDDATAADEEAPVVNDTAEPGQDVAATEDAPREASPVADAPASAARANVVPFTPKPTPKPKEPPPADSGDSFGSGFSMPPAKRGGAAAQPAARRAGPQEVIKISAELLEELVNLAGETSISRGRLETQINDLGGAIDEIDGTLSRLQEQLRRLDIETEAQIIFRQEQMAAHEDFDPLEMDRYSHLQQLSRSLIESASDLVDLKNTLTDKVKDTETLLLQQSRVNTNLQEGLMRSRMVPFSRLVPRLRRIVRQVAAELGKNVSFELDNIEGEMDRSVLERMVAPLEHMLRNAVDHGIETPDDRAKTGKPETGRIVLSLAREGGDILLRLVDDGRGINLERVRAKAIERGLMAENAQLSEHDIMQFILHAGFSTADSVTQISGRGVGMDVVHSEIKQLGGSMSIASRAGEGTEFSVRLPFTVSVNRALMVTLGTDQYAIPLNAIEGIVRVSPFELEHYYSNADARFEYAGENFQVRYLGAMLQEDARPRLEAQSLPLPVILVRSEQHTMALQVDSLMGSREIVVKSLGQQFSMVQGLSGATVMGDGSVVVILDLHALVRKEMAQAAPAPVFTIDETARLDQQKSEALKTVMVVDDSVTVRKVTSRFLEREGYNVITAKDGVEALQILQDELPDVMLLDIEMPRMDGFEVAKNIRSTSRWQDIPIIMITSRTGEKHREHALSLGVNRYMGKPYQEEALLESINDLLAK